MNKSFKIVGLLVLACLLLLNSALLMAQDEGIRLHADFATFRYQANRLNFEFYYSIYHPAPKYVENRWLGQVHLTISKEDSVILADAWKVQGNRTDEDATAKPVSILDRIQYVIPAGKYIVKAKIVDLYDDMMADSIEFTADLKAFNDETPILADIQLAAQIQRGAQEKAHPFYKNSLLVIPNPSRIYGENIHFVHFYTEIYNLNTIKNSDVYKFRYSVTNSDEMAVQGIPTRELTRRISVDANAETGVVRVDSIPSGTYNLHVFVLDAADNVLQQRDLRFYVYNPSIQAAVSLADIDLEGLYALSEFVAMTEDELNQEIDYLSYVMQSDDKKQYDAITDFEQKKRWLFKFWKKVDSNLATPLNEFRAEYLKRVDYANQNFAGFQLDGWKSDRGRVYILYGAPTFEEKHPNSSFIRPHIIWRYDELQNGVEFVFVDFSVNRQYRLVHSDLIGEIQNINWRDQAEKGTY